MKRKSTKGRKASVSQEIESDSDEALSSVSDENLQENGDRTRPDVEEPKEKRRKSKGKNVDPEKDEGDKPEKSSPQKKAGRGRKSKDHEKSRTDETEGSEDDKGEEDVEKSSPQKKAGRGRKPKDHEKSRTDETEGSEDDKGEEDVEKKNSPQRKSGRGRNSKIIEKSRSDEMESDVGEENGEAEEDEYEDNLSKQRKSSPQRKAGRGRKSKDLEKSKGNEIMEIEGSEEDEEKEEEEDEEYEVDKVIDEKMIRGKRHLLIRWKGYGAESDTWEPEVTLNCPEAIEIFKKTKKALTKNPDKKGKKNLKTPEPEETWDANENFEVVRILDVYFRKDGKKEFLVAWKGYPNSANSWEPEENMDCKDMIQSFLEKCDRARQATQKDLRINRKTTHRFTLSTKDSGRRLSKRNQGSQRVHYHDAE